jgi:prevent-host-death family protein
MAERISLAKFRTRVAEIVRKAESGQPTILTNYHRDVAAIVSIHQFKRCEKDDPSSDPAGKKRTRSSHE